MQNSGNTRFGPSAFVWSLAGLGILPILPEIVLAVRTGADFRAFRATGYYESVVSFLLLAPALVLSERLSKLWVTAYTLVVLPVTLIADLRNGRRRSLECYGTHRIAGNQSDRGVGISPRRFVSFDVCAWMLFFAVAFAGGLFVNRHSRQPLRRSAWIGIAVGILLSGYGARLAILYIKHPFDRTTSESVRVFGAGPIERHPLVLIAGAHYNYYFSRRYYMKHYREAAAHFGGAGRGRHSSGSSQSAELVLSLSVNRRTGAIGPYTGTGATRHR